jgi:eukaryotic-like serine/threonine-protein kinase
MSLEGQLLGRYRILRLIGSGGMGEVYLADDPTINRQVAIKVVHTEAADNSGTERSKGAARLFQREAKAIAMLDHTYILPLYDYGEQEINGVGFAYLVMPYRQEGSLAYWLQQGGAAHLLIQDVEQIVQQAASALQYAHDHQIVHQDIKPSNFLVRTNKDNPQRPDLLLTDFGIAKLSTLTSSVSQSIRGTPTYMAPEQWEGHPVPATDQYALAVMVYELLTGHPPFRGNPMQMMYAHVNTQPEAPSRRNPRLSPAIDAVILRALAKKPEERFPSIQAFASAFRQALSGIDPATPLGTSNHYVPPIGSTPSTPGIGDIYATLAISEEEARNGTNRTLTLPSGRKVIVSIPAGVHDGQIVEVDEQNQQISGGNAVERLHLTLSVRPTLQEGMVSPLPLDENASTRDASTALIGREKTGADDGPTLFTSTDKLPTRNDSWASIPPGRAGTRLPDAPSPPPVALPLANEVGTTHYRGEPAISTRPRKFSKTSALLLILLALLLVLGSAGLFLYYGGHGSGPGPADGATATTQASLFATATAESNGTAGTNNTNATATAQTNAIAGATATAQANASATAIAQSNATATSVASGANPYPPHSGTLILNDPLSDNSGGHKWREYSDSATGDRCQFTGGAYHVVEAPHYGGPCFAFATDFSNFTFQVQMTFVQAGQSFDGGGLAIRNSGNSYYYFEIFESGRYVFAACTGNDCSHAVAESLSQSIPSFHTGLNQTNTIALVAQGNAFTLYVNGQRVVGPVTDTNSTSSHGMIGVYGEGYDVTTEIVYSNAKVWA